MRSSSWAYVAPGESFLVALCGAFYGPFHGAISCSGTAFVGRKHLVEGRVPAAAEAALSHDDAWSTHRLVGSNHAGDFGERRCEPRRLSAAAGPSPSCKGGGVGREEEAPGDTAQYVRSPPRFQPPASAPPAVCPRAAASAATAVGDEARHSCSTASSRDNEQHGHPSRLRGDGVQTKERGFGEDEQSQSDRKACQGQPATAKSHLQEEDDGFCNRASGQAAPRTAQAAAASGPAGAAETERARPREANGFYISSNKGSRAASVAPPAPSRTTTTVKRHHQGGGGRAEPDCAVRDNWGSVFVVGGGRRKRRPPVMQNLLRFPPGVGLDGMG